MDRLLLLIPTTSYRVADFMAAAARLGVEIVVGSDRRSVLEEFAPGRTLTLDFADAADGAGRISAYATENPLRAIIGVDEQTALVAAVASKALGLAHNSPDSVAATVNKHRMRAALANSGLPAPGFSLAPVADGPEAAAARVSYPCVLKPLALSGSRGVIRADDATGFVTAFRRIATILAGTADSILVEDYIPGAEVALEGLLEDGRLTTLALFDKPDPMQGPHFEETIYVTPSGLDAAMQRAVADTAARGAAALGLRHGPVHCELRINQRGVWIIELAARSIGGLCARSLDFGAGLRLEDLILNHALGRPLAAVRREAHAAGVMMIPIPSGGVLQGVGGLEAARAVEGIIDVRITIPVGGPVVPLPEGDRYLGFIFAHADHPEQAEAALRRAHAMLTFDIEPAAGQAGRAEEG
jgi:biotin carboxylase